jgi:hypothetical protein
LDRPGERDEDEGDDDCSRQDREVVSIKQLHDGQAEQHRAR